jgi:hypothetical protein
MSERQVAVIVGVVGCVGLVLVSPILFTVAAFLYFAMAGMIAETGLIARDNVAEQYQLLNLLCLTPFMVIAVVIFIRFWRNRGL